MDLTTPTPPDVINALMNIQVSLARHDQMLTNIGDGQKEIKADQKEIKEEQREIRKDYSTLATVVNTLQGQVNTMQVQLNTTQGQVGGLLTWQLTVTQQKGTETVTINDRIYEVKTDGWKRIISVQAWPLTVIGGGILTAVLNHFLHFLP